MADILPRNGNFRFLLTDSYFESSDVADQVADIPPQKMVILDFYLQIPTPKSSHVTDLPPWKMVNLDSFL